MHADPGGRAPRFGPWCGNSPWWVRYPQSQSCIGMTAELGIPMAREHSAIGDTRAMAAILFKTIERVGAMPDLPAIAPAWEPPKPGSTETSTQKRV